jgi:hypothetical protein
LECITHLQERGKQQLQVKNYSCFDTDWIGTGITWKDLTLLFREEVPIITNQESIFFGSGIKVVGIVKKRIRDRLDRKERIKAVHKSHWKNFILEEVHDRIFMSDCLLNLQIHNVIQRMTINYALNQIPFYRNMSNEEWVRKFPKAMRVVKYV